MQRPSKEATVISRNRVLSLTKSQDFQGLRKLHTNLLLRMKLTHLSLMDLMQTTGIQ